MIEIIKRGTPPSERVYEAACHHCTTQIRFKESEARREKCWSRAEAAEAALATARRDERERCAKVASAWKSSLRPGTYARQLGHEEAAIEIGAAIRALPDPAPEAQTPASNDGLSIGEQVEKVGGDYSFAGTVVAAFHKRSGADRFVVEDDRGVLHVYSAKNLRLARPDPAHDASAFKAADELLASRPAPSSDTGKGE